MDKRKAAAAGVKNVVARADGSGRLAARSHFDCQLQLSARSGEVIYFSSERAKLGAAHSSARFPTLATNRQMHGITNSSLGRSYPSCCRHRLQRTRHPSSHHVLPMASRAELFSRLAYLEPASLLTASLAEHSRRRGCVQAAQNKCANLHPTTSLHIQQCTLCCQYCAHFLCTSAVFGVLSRKLVSVVQGLCCRTHRRLASPSYPGFSPFCSIWFGTQGNE
jgi:hypothetical protein